VDLNPNIARAPDAFGVVLFLARIDWRSVKYPVAMQDRNLYVRLLGIEDPWCVMDVTLRLEEEQAVVVSVEMGSGSALHCPKCQNPGSRYVCLFIIRYSDEIADFSGCLFLLFVPRSRSDRDAERDGGGSVTAA